MIFLFTHIFSFVTHTIRKSVILHSAVDDFAAYPSKTEEMEIIMKKNKRPAGAKKLLALCMVLAYMCVATACTNDNNGNNSGNMAGNNASSESGTNAPNDNGTNNNNNSVTNGTDNNANNGDSLLDDAGNTVGDIVDDAANGVMDITDDIVGDGNSTDNNSGLNDNNGINDNNGTVNGNGTAADGNGTLNNTSSNGVRTGNTGTTLR